MEKPEDPTQNTVIIDKDIKPAGHKNPRLQNQHTKMASCFIPQWWKCWERNQQNNQIHNRKTKTKRKPNKQTTPAINYKTRHKFNQASEWCLQWKLQKCAVLVSLSYCCEETEV